MKKYSLVLFLTGLLLAGCDFLDKQPDDMKTDAMVWRSRIEVEKYLTNCYAAIPYHNLHQDDPWLGLSDECDIPWVVYWTYDKNLGNWNPSSYFYMKYTPWYKAIRATHKFEQNVDRCLELSDNYKTRYKAEVKFLRAYYHFLLLRQYGPIVLIQKPLPNSTDFTSMMRSPYDECVNYICDLLDEAAEDLPYHWWNDQNNLGRPTKVVCKAVKAVLLNLAASPQFNGNKEYAEFTNPDGTQLINQTFDMDKWKRAAQAAKDVIDIAEQRPDVKLRLYRNDVDGGDKTFNPYKSCVDVQLKVWNPEIIWARTNTWGLQAWMIHCVPGPSCLGGVGPTLRLVDAFLMENGKPIEDPESGYVETGWADEPGPHWNPHNLQDIYGTERVKMIQDIRSCDAWGHWAGEWNMFCNREPRFYASILYNKRISPCLPEDKDKRDYYSSEGQRNGYARAELYYGGVSRGSDPSYTFYSKTGILAFKRNDPQADMHVGARIFPQIYNDVFIRYAEILLDYIEALNEYDPGNPDIRKYWDQIRSRAGVPSAFEASPQIAGDQNLQRDFILRERQIELCLEGDRYFTTRRRWLAETPDAGGETDDRKFGDGGRIWGFDINAGDRKTNSFAFEGFYHRVPVETRVFKKAYYLFPIPQDEIDKSPNLVQNPFWNE